MSKINEHRRANIRALVEERGGLTKLSKAMGYKNPSFLSQMIGPEPTREVTERTARKIEEVLGLRPNSLDQAPGGAPPQSSTTVAMVADVIRLVGTACESEGVAPTPAKFAEIVALVYSDSMERGSTRPDQVKQLVRLLR